MNPGEIVKIYEDPLSEKKLEGEARLRRCLSKTYDLETWEVKFPDGMIAKRRILRKKRLTVVIEGQTWMDLFDLISEVGYRIWEEKLEASDKFAKGTYSYTVDE